MTFEADAILFWGYCWSDRGAKPWETGEVSGDPDDIYAENTGIRRADMPYQAYIDARNAAVEAAGCAIVEHNTAASPMYGIAVAASVFRTSWGRPAPVPALNVDPMWRPLLDGYCAAIGIDISGRTPAWHLAAYLG